jgi:tetratricopeptide (TPR) repeat protein
MLRISTSDPVKARIKGWLPKLLTYANIKPTDIDYIDYDRFYDKVSIRSTTTDNNLPALLVRTKLEDLANLVFPNQLEKNLPALKEQLRHDLSVLEQFLKILEDHRVKKQGAAYWHFTLKLWHKSVDENMRAFEQAWNQKKTAATKAPLKKRSTPPHPPATPETTEAISQPAPQPTLPQHNLPSRQHTAFIGHKTHLTRLLKLLSNSHPAHLISIEGVAGVGKTTLVLETAHRCLQATQHPEAFPGTPTFAAIVFTSAQSQSFIGPSLSQRLRPEQNLRDIFRVINRTLNHLDILPPDFNTQHDAIRESLACQTCLLIVDNLETLDDQTYVLSFLRELSPTVKVVLTSRVKIGFGTVLRLDCLNPEDGSLLIQHQTHEKNIQLSELQARSLYQKTGGLPLSIVYTIGQIAVQGLPPENILANLNPSNSDLVHYCFETSFHQLQGQPAQQLLKAMSLFPQPAAIESLTYVALGTAKLTTTQQGLAELYRRSLVEIQQGRYTLHSLTREYITADLNAHPHHTQVLRSRWIIWYLNLAEPYLDLDWQEWQDYSTLEQDWENLRAAVEWCREQQRYEDFKQFWQRLKGFTLFCGYWLERLDWLDWLTEAAQQRHDEATAAEALYQKSRTLAHINQVDPTGDALSLGEQAWARSSAQDWQFRFDVAIYLATLWTRMQQFQQAHHWLNQSETLLQPPVEEVPYIRRWIQTRYCRAELYWRTQNHAQAKQLYSDALAAAETINWQLMMSYIQGWMAALALEQGDLPEAERLLQRVLQAAEQNNDKRSLAYCQRYFALLEQARQNQPAVRQWAASAQTSFERLRMTNEAAEMRRLLQT